MLDTSNWPIAELDVIQDLRLDSKNVRLEMSDQKVESDIIEDLFVNEKAFELVEGICRIGYLTHEIPVALKHGEQYIVVEGNRRLAALKAIQNPLLVPGYKARIEKEVSRLGNREELSRIKVMIAPNRDSANQLIAAIHTGNLRKPWGPARQAAFFQVQLKSGRTLSELIARYPTIDVKKFALRALLLNRIEDTALKRADTADFIVDRQWKKSVSTVTRIFDAKPVKDMVGASLSDSGQLEMSISENMFDKIALVILDGLREKTLILVCLTRLRVLDFQN